MNPVLALTIFAIVLFSVPLVVYLGMNLYRRHRDNQLSQTKSDSERYSYEIKAVDQFGEEVPTGVGIGDPAADDYVVIALPEAGLAEGYEVYRSTAGGEPDLGEALLGEWSPEDEAFYQEALKTKELDEAFLNNLLKQAEEELAPKPARKRKSTKKSTKKKATKKTSRKRR